MSGTSGKIPQPSLSNGQYDSGAAAYKDASDIITVSTSTSTDDAHYEVDLDQA